ncbi:MAG: histidine phosphatase family protein [Clostridia bacterium]|nr:histidine phosphatase family protein [Clostridia bacterium]
MKLYVIRHGESENNQAKLYTGWAQVTLTEKGFEDAKGIRPLLEHIHFDRIYTSDLLRAKQTAETACPGIDYMETPLLREYNVGSLSGLPPTTVTVKNRDFTPFGGENRDMMRARVQEFMHLIEAYSAETVAAFSHAGWLRMMLSTVLKTELHHDTIRCSNCTVAIFEYSNGSWTLHSWINPQ